MSATREPWWTVGYIFAAGGIVSDHPHHRFLLLHGWENRRPPEHWQWQLAESLRREGEQVRYPQFPEPDTPSLPDWLQVLTAEMAMLGTGERVVIAHSLGCLLWLHAINRGLVETVDRVLLVAPPSPVLLSTYDAVREFAAVVLDADAVRAVCPNTVIVCGDRDPYCPEGVEAAFGVLRVPTQVLTGARHINPDSGYGPWPSLVRWCVDPAVPLTGR